jgi:aspartate/methionine/tyrosine aminotransferase/prephenate dehydratase/prephenate dehydrogenase
MGEVKVAYQGMPGAYSEKATRQLLGSSPNVVAIGFPSFEEAFQAVENEDVQFAVLPIENSLGGSIHANYDLLLKYGLHIVAEYDLRVEHSLLALPGVKKEDIKTVISHPQALAQCTHTIAKMGAKARAEYDTAGSAKMLADNQWKDTAAVASDLAAEYYGLQVLERNVEDDESNFTRFLLLSKKEDLGLDAKSDTEFKTSLVFSFMDSNEKGQLYKALSAFSLRDIDMAKIESRPWGYSAAQQLAESVDSPDFSISSTPDDRRKYKYLFYVDIIGHQTDESIVNALRHLREFCKFVRVLGSFPTKGKLLGDARKTLEAVGAFQSNSVTLSPATAPQQTPRVRLKIGVYGFGNFGQFLAKTMSKFHQVRATSRTDYSAVAAQLGCEYYSSTTQLEQFFDGLDVVILCVSILSFENVVKSIPSHLLEKLVIVDVLSVKTHPKQILLKELPASSSILCTHPMFGPESGKYSWRGLPMMYEKVRVLSGEHSQQMDSFLRIFEDEMCRMLELSCESHDEFAASSQFLTHLTGRVLGVQGVKNTPIDTRGFKNLVRLVEDTCKDSFDLFQGLYEFNPNSEQQIQKFQDSLAEVAQQLKNKATKPSTGGETMAEKYPLNPLLNKVTAAKTVVIHGLTKQLEAEGTHVWSLCVGEPDFAPDARVLQAGMRAMEQGKVKYTDVKGTNELRVLIGEYLDKCKGVKYDPQSEILISNGAKQSVYQALLAICKPGEKVVIPSPYWVSYPAIAKLVGAEPVVFRTKIEEDYLIDAKALEVFLDATAGVKAIILCNPSNPAGTLHLPHQLEEIAAVLRKPRFRHILIVADEIYEQLIYQDGDSEPKRSHQCFASLPEMYERTLVVNGFSKSHAMPGLRIGYLAAPKYFVQQCTKLQGQFTSCASSASQIAAAEAMTLEMECVAAKKKRITDVLKVMDEKRHFILKRISQIPNLRFAYPTSAFYVFLDLAPYFEGKTVYTAERKQVLKNVDDYVEYLLLQYHVALVPGSAFGEDFGMRISYASSMETLENAMNGLEDSLKSLIVE